MAMLTPAGERFQAAAAFVSKQAIRHTHTGGRDNSP